jgi:hypothetical protein
MPDLPDHGISRCGAVYSLSVKLTHGTVSTNAQNFSNKCKKSYTVQIQYNFNTGTKLRPLAANFCKSVTVF